MKAAGLIVGRWRTGQARRPEGEPPLRAELFGVEQLAQHARDLAARHRIVPHDHANRLLARLDANERSLRAFNRGTVAVEPVRRITPAAEWLLDNFYLIEEQIQLARRHLPKGYSRELPGLTNGASAGLPRVYDIVLELIAHVDAQIDAGPLSAFVAAYQSGAALKLGELWAIPIMLRLGLIENLQRIATRLTFARADRDLADRWVDRLQEVAERHPSQLVVVVADMAKADLPVTCAFVAEFNQRLSRQSPVLQIARHWLEQHLGEQGLSMAQLVHQESQHQAADQVSVSHCIASLRFLGAMDWKTFVESSSGVEATLRRDPAGVYALMDFATRDRYRHEVEALARQARCGEEEVAQAAVDLAAGCAGRSAPGDRSTHVGFFLIDRGVPQLERHLRVRCPWSAALERGIRRFPGAFYLGGIGGLTMLLTGLFWREMAVRSDHLGLLVAMIPFFLLGASQLAVLSMNGLSTLWVHARRLPRLDFSSGVPAECRTMVAVPTMLTSVEEVDRLVEKLEIHYLSNRDDCVHFALLTDFRDAAAETQPEDDLLLARAAAGIGLLNRKYPAREGNAFALFHRPRRWNAREGRWMGHERKRGKLADFNALLRGGAPGRFSAVVGGASLLSSVKYVIALDTDTQLPRDAARKLVGTMAHPLNRPVFDRARGIVTDGYGILQPRVCVSLPGARRSWFVRLLAGDAGIDPYTRAVSDVYQDLFGEGSFIGKGIYDVDAFEQALRGRFPENTVLSHDLLEACHARSGLASDVEVYEEHPSRYNVDMARRHRWIRGDWQIVQWLGRRVPAADGGRSANPLSLLSQWKLFDNLRRSLVPAGLLALLLHAWLAGPAPILLGALPALAILALPGVIAILIHGLRRPSDLPWTRHLRGVAETAARQSGQVLLGATFLPYEAHVSLDAIGRTLVRLLATRRRLLEWQTSDDAERASGASPAGFLRTMWSAPAFAALVGLGLVMVRPAQLPAALPFLGLWLAAPWIAWWISRPIVPAEPALSDGQQDFLHRTARRTWHYFEMFVTAEENWLPPDNFQEFPTATVATRTSPTNMGLALLANQAAVDFGYLSVGGLIRRTGDALATMQTLERHRGHFYNWYDTRSRQPLPPHYVSFVDSGNLAGHLLTLGSGLRELADRPLCTPQVFAGLRDTVRVLLSLAPGRADLAKLDGELAVVPATLSGGYALLGQVARQANALVARQAEEADEVRSWLHALRRDAAEHLADLRWLAPWLELPATDRPEASPGDAGPGPTLRETAGWEPPAEAGPDPEASPELTRCRREAAEHARERLMILEELAGRAEGLAAMDFAFLYNRAMELFCTGFNVTERRHDAGFYDLLASEARLGSYVAIALGQVPQEHWFALGRLLIAARGQPLLVSWSGSMFEYLMPMLVMPHYANTLLDHTCRAAVARQMEYGRLRGVPWGISESGYNRTDVHLNYQYRAFGVPGLGFKRGLAEDLVIAPYASAMALMVAPVEACENLQRLAAEGRAGRYGFYEAVDYTPARLRPDEAGATIRSHMVHHQGMTLLALGNVLHGFPLHRRFLACPLLKATDLLLQERMPKAAASVLAGDLNLDEDRPPAGGDGTAMRVIANPGLPAPEVHLLSNGRYHVAITSAGGGYSRWRDLAVTRWREDGTCDDWGTFVYLRDTATGAFWSVAHQPTLSAAPGYEAIFTEARAEFRSRQGGLDVHTEICVSPEDDVELRRVTLANLSDAVREIELTSYAEVVLARPEADAAHPAFSNLFVQTEFAPEWSALLGTRRPRGEGDVPPWMFHLLVGQGGEQGPLSCETDRGRFVGRGGSLRRPEAMANAGPLSNTVGSVLDPIASLRRKVTLPPNATTVLTLATGVAETRAGALALAEKYQSARMADRAFDLAWTHGQVTLRQLEATEAEARLYGRMAGALIHADPARRASAGILRSNRRGQSALWSHGVSGDVPVVLLTLGDAGKIELARQLVVAHAYWRMKGLATELVILTEDVSGYHQSLHGEVTGLVSAGGEGSMLDKPGGILVRRLEQVAQEDRLLLQAVARLVIDDAKGTLAQQLGHRRLLDPVVPALLPTRAARASEPWIPAGRELIFFNGLGGFAADGSEYVIALAPGQMTPAPWVNVIANPTFGTVVSEAGSAYTWVENAREFRLTPWHNDSVRDPGGEALYIRDEQTGQFWSPTPLPARGTTPYVIRHGFGYTVYEHAEHGLISELWVYVAADAPVKFSVLKLRNVSGRPRRVSVTGYWEWVLGDLRAKSLLHVQTEADPKTGALLARNLYNTEFPDRVAFVDVDDPARTLTGDRREFIGRNGSLAAPAALRRERLSGTVGAGLDPCGAVQVAFDLPDGHERETAFRLGVGRSPADVQELIQRHRQPGAVRGALAEVRSRWERLLGTVRVDTPDPAANVMANGWLLYHTLGARLWGRTGFHQSGGAYGFRDQLQDVLALLHAGPALAREHLLRAAARQFREGDVQHWWHPPGGRGVRTHFSDDFLWLPYVVCRYVAGTGDDGVLDEKIPFLEGRPVKPEEEACYDLPTRTEETATLYRHCAMAVERGLRFGVHVLPLMGCGDWNDGMNRVGHEGRGESVWLAFFLHDVLTHFAALARSRRDPLFADRCVAEAATLQANIERHAWDGAWYRRAYFDNGEPLGSASNAECQIDSLPQSWAVLGGAADPARARQAMESVDRRLVRRADRLIRLFDPPFDRSSQNPGYIKGYIPGVRENGGQYTHGAVWAAMAFAHLGETERAWELFALLNPVNHGGTAERIATYKVEPYVVAADVYALEPHTGRGGWTWYTGSAGWMYRLLVETLLGVHREGDSFRLVPRLPQAWPSYTIRYRFGSTYYRIAVSRAEGAGGGAVRLVLDGGVVPGTTIPLVDDRREHIVDVKVPVRAHAVPVPRGTPETGARERSVATERALETWENEGGDVAPVSGPPSRANEASPGPRGG